MANSSSSISTPKKIALAVLGALVLMTFVNLIQANVHKYKDEAAIVIHEAVDVLHKSERSVNTDARDGAGELMIDERFDVSEGEKLSVQVGDADIVVSTHAENEAHVQIFLDGRNMDRAREYFEDQRFEVSREDGTVYVITRPVRKNYSWNRLGSPQITIEIAVPRVFDAELKTSDGDVTIEELAGSVSIHTSDGDIATGSVEGPSFVVRTSDGDIRTKTVEADEASVTTSDGDINVDAITADEISIRTSDGDIRIERIEGNAAISTSDGDLSLTSVTGRTLALRTSDGEIRVDEIDADESQVQTSDGSIALRRVSGSLTAKTSSGDLIVSIAEAGEETYLITGDGDIQLSVPGDLSAELSLKGERVRISSSFRFDGQLKEDVAEGRINGGGARIQARTSDGEVIFREN